MLGTGGGDAVALARVYCGLASAKPPQQLAVGSSSLSATVVDDAGRLLDVCDIGDDPYGYAYLSTLLAERASGPYSVAIAADSDQRLVPALLVTAGWALAYVDDQSTDEFADRFADLSEEVESAPTQRRALGLARALHAGAVSASLMPPRSDLTGLKPVLAAHGALATGRHAAAVALREVLRELYPAALRAYPDPADPVALAVIDALPEPGALAALGRGRDAAATTDAVAARIAASGVADQAAISEAITALRVALAETPRRSTVSRGLTGAVAEAVRQSVAAVRACDAASTVLVRALVDRVAPAGAARASAHSDTSPAESGSYAAGSRSYAAESASHRSDPGAGAAASPRHQAPADPLAEPAAAQDHPRVPPTTSSPPAPVSPAGAGQSEPRSTHGRPVSAPPPPPPGITPIAEPRAPIPSPRLPERPYGDPLGREFGGPGREESPPAGIGSERDNRPAWAAGSSPDAWKRPRPEAAGAGGWNDEWRDRESEWRERDREWRPNGQPHEPEPAAAEPRQSGVTPPWRADDLRPPEPPPLRLVEPSLPEELRDDFGYQEPSEPPPLRLVEPTSGTPRSAPPVSADDDDTLLIFAQTRSAWFTGATEESTWNSELDAGWRAAEQAAQRPTVGERTGAGLPRRVPRANLVPGSAANDRPLRVVRDPQSIAAHTSGYFNGWRRGQQVGGYPLGNRQASGGAWDFNRDEERLSG
ncbi:MAG TPA: transposase [Natronosporangium sp.]|nr:transposase [Natronosporangium sp.]